MSGKKETYKLFNLPWYYFAIFAVLVLIATYTGTLPKGMSGCFAFMIVLGTILYEIGEKTPIIRSYLGGGAIVVLFGTALLNYFTCCPRWPKRWRTAQRSTTWPAILTLLAISPRSFSRPVRSLISTSPR